MSEFVDCRTCKTDCVRADGNYGYTFCNKYTHPPMTNADRIRSMSDEELTRKMTDGNGFFGCPQCSQGDCRKCDLECGKHCLEWLQQPADEASHG